MMTPEIFREKWDRTLKEISDIELTNDKSKRLRWRELQKVKKWLESIKHEYDT